MREPKKYRSKSLRLKGYDYTQEGCYFITIDCRNMKHMYGKIEKGKMIKNQAGEMIEEEWLALPQRFTNIALYEYIVMPNHFHAILEIRSDDISTSNTTQKKKALGDMIGAFKSITTVEYIRGVKTKSWKRFEKKLWKEDYWEHIIRNERSFINISNYIKNNPQNWKKDDLYNCT